MAGSRKRLSIYGRVQGVFYRAWSVGEAERLGLAGWVRNRADGSVEMLIEGEEAAVAEMIGRCREGPPGARVERVEVEESALPAPARFEKRPTV